MSPAKNADVSGETKAETLLDSRIARIDRADHFELISKLHRCVEEILAFLPES